MPVKIRLTRMGKKKQPSYRVVVMDSRKSRDGAYIEQIGRYDPREEPSIVEIDNDKALHWLERGAQPTDRAKKLLEISGAWTRFRVAKGDIHTIGTTAAPAAPGPIPTAEPAAAEPEPVAVPGSVVAAEPVAIEPEPAVAEDAGEVAAGLEADLSDATAVEAADVSPAESADVSPAEAADVSPAESVEVADEPPAVPDANEAAAEDAGSEEEEQA